MRRHVVFLVNLLQDVNIVRPLVHLAARELGASILFLMSDKFVERDTQGIWQAEIQELAAEVGGAVQVYESEFDAFRALAGKAGVLIAASESNLSAHTHTHNVFRAAPAAFLKVTLQHGFECVGFLQNRDHSRAHGRNVTFAADVICGWCDLAAMPSVAPSERSKYFLTGPSALLQEVVAIEPADAQPGGLVCENLHSVRMRGSGDHKASFMETFFAFCAEIGRQGRTVTMRPHPGGQYVLKNNVELPSNVGINNLPMYKVDLRRFEFGISAPSSVLIDMVLAGLPVAVWQDEDGLIDASNYEGLTAISGLHDWLAFERDVHLRPAMLLERQAGFLRRSRLMTDRRQARERFARLLAGALDIVQPLSAASPAAERVLFITNGLIPTLQLSFIKPLAAEVEAGRVAWKLVTGEDMRQNSGSEIRVMEGEAEDRAKQWLSSTMAAFEPTLVVFCRYSDPFADFIVEQARSRGIPTVFHVDDDLLNVPKEIGEAKHRAHNAPERLATVRYLLGHVDLVYCSTAPLLRRFRSLGFDTPMMAGTVYCPGAVLNPAALRPVRKIGYMGFDHEHDFELVLPALVQVLRDRPALTFDLFGSIPKPKVLDEFGDRITVVPPVRIYAEFLTTFASLGWDIGLCPLAPTPFNRLKANTKWVEYTSIGAAVVATRGMAYDDCCSGGCGELVESTEDWVHRLETLCDDPQRRHDMVRAAQEKLQQEYSEARLREQIRGVFRQARDRRAAASARAAGPASDRP